MPRVQRDSAWNQREYGSEKWPVVEAWIEDALNRGERELARVLSLTARRERELPADALAYRSTCVMGRTMDLPAVAAVAAHDAMVVENVIRACRQDTEVIVELGAGWGRNLAAVWLAGGPAGACYVAAEVTESGRRIAERIAGLADGFDLRAVPYDFENPTGDFVTGAAHAVAFTCHGIGQVPSLPDAAIDAIIDLAPEVTCVHVEPIGWQIREDLEGHTAQYAEEHDYNRNLWLALQAAEGDGRLAIDRVLVDAIGGNPLHPSSVVIWHAGPDGARA